jgi:hypothetical protein
VAAILFQPTAAVAGTSSSAAPAAQTSQISWQTLSMLNPSGAIALGGAAVAAQPAADVPPPPPLGPPPPDGGIGTPPLPVIAVWLATIAVAIWILAHKHGHGTFEFPQPNSPG